MNHAEPPGQAAPAGGGTLGACGPARRAGGAGQPERTVPCSRPGSPCLPDGRTDRQTDRRMEAALPAEPWRDGWVSPGSHETASKPRHGETETAGGLAASAGKPPAKTRLPPVHTSQPSTAPLSGVSPHTSRLSPGAPREPCSVPPPAPWELGAGQAGAPGRCCRHRFSHCRNICSACHFFSLL